ncbi:monocarboxylate transporter 14 [Plakobranchus ocellatus]|uniref:Monocarboxylate transporter 14 n=1 Tax=Plakobranchus ocellatus TaxID=259542 RepID=A0AAV4CP48_9GAST|nr:monocarboxylate transporter 14 [Plakobranchus ocellatus]
MRLPANMESGKKGGFDGAGAYNFPADDDCEAKKCLAYEEDEEEEEPFPYPRHPTPPDGGWAWMVMLSAFLCMMVVDGMCFSFAALRVPFIDEFDTTHSKASWIGSSMAGCYLLAGPFVATMIAKYGCRKVAVAGSILSCFGLLMSERSTNANMMIATFGVIGGFGLGMIYLSAIVAVGHWFDKKRAFATGFAYVGSGFSQFIFPPLGYYLLEIYNWKGVIYILAGIVLNCAVCGMVFIPVKKWVSTMKRRRPVNNNKVEINHGEIMKALIESKQRQRTISNGSLDNCVITRDNKVIKLDPKLFEGKRNNSLIARFCRQLGFSSQSLASSKNSLQQGIPSIVIDAVHKDMNMKAAAAAAAAGGSASLNGSPIYRPNGMTRVQQLSSGSLNKRGSLPNEVMLNRGCARSNPALLSSTRLPNGSSIVGAAANGSIPSPCKVSKTMSCDVIPTNRAFPVPTNSYAAGESSSNQGTGLVRSASDLQAHAGVLPFDLANMEDSELKIQSIQLLPNNTAHGLAAARAKGLRCRSSHSESSAYSFDGFSYCPPQSTQGSTVLYSSAGSLPHSQAVIEEVENELSSSEISKRSFPAKCLHVVMQMLQIKLLLNPMCFLLILSSFSTVMAFYIPYFYLPSKGLNLGLDLRQTEFLFCIIGVTNTVGRIVSGWLADRPWVSALYLYSGALVFSGVAIVFVPFCVSETSLAFMAAVFGMCMAISTSLRTILLVECLGLEQLANSFGLLCLFQGVAALIGAPIAGELLDQTKNIDHCFYMAGSLIVFAGLLMFPIKCLQTVPQAKTSLIGSPDLVQACGPITQTLTMEQLAATSRV